MNLRSLVSFTPSSPSPRRMCRLKTLLEGAIGRVTVSVPVATSGTLGTGIELQFTGSGRVIGSPRAENRALPEFGGT